MWTLVEARHHRPFNVTDRQWPVWIHGSPKSGGSFATVVLTANFVRRGERVVFLCAHGEAIRALQAELELPKPELRAKTMSAATQATIQDMQLITLRHEKGNSLVAMVRSLPDLSERILILKNIEDLRTSDVVELVGMTKRVVLSGDFLKNDFSLAPEQRSTIMYFSEPPKSWGITYESLPTYIGQYRKSGIYGQCFAQEKVAIDKY